MTAAVLPIKNTVWESRVRDRDGTLKHVTDANLNLRTNAGNDWQDRVMFGGATAMVTGSATSPTATGFSTTGLTASALVDHLVILGATYGVVTANTTTAVTVDKWYNPAAPGGAAAATPAAGTFVTTPGSAPAVYLALSTTVQSGAAGDTVLAGEIGAGDGLSRAYWTTYTHSAASSSTSLSKTFTATTTKTVNSEGVFTALSSGTLVFEAAETSPPTLVAGDTLAQTVTCTY